MTPIEIVVQFLCGDSHGPYSKQAVREMQVELAKAYLTIKAERDGLQLKVEAMEKVVQAARDAVQNAEPLDESGYHPVPHWDFFSMLDTLRELDAASKREGLD